MFDSYGTLTQIFSTYYNIFHNLRLHITMYESQCKIAGALSNAHR